MASFVTTRMLRTLAASLAVLWVLCGCTAAELVVLHGPPQEVEARLYHLFPVGTVKEEIPRTMDERLAVEAPTNVFANPSVLRWSVGEKGARDYQTRNGKSLRIHSSLTMTLHYWNWVLRANRVTVDFLFDEDAKLVWIEVQPESDSP